MIRDVERQIDKLREKKIQILEKKERAENPSAAEPEKKKHSEEELAVMRKRRQELLERQTERDQLSTELNKLGSLANQQKTKLLNRLANTMDSPAALSLSEMELDVQEKKILDAIDDTTSKRERQEIEDMEHLLKLHDPLYGKTEDPESLNKISIGIEKFRCPDVVSSLTHQSVGMYRVHSIYLSFVCNLCIFLRN